MIVKAPSLDRKEEGYGTILRFVVPTLLAMGALFLVPSGDTATNYAQGAQPLFPVWMTFQQPSAKTEELWREVLDAAEYKANDISLVKSYYIPNAMAICVPVVDAWNQPIRDPRTGRFVERKFVVYNPYFFAQVDVQANSEECVPIKGVLAHELGHHVRGHVSVNQTWQSWAKHSHQKELEADEYSGFIMKKLDASETDIETTIRLMFQTWDSPTHPNSIARIGAISKGYYGDEEPIELNKRLEAVYTKLSTQLAQWH